MRPWLLEVNLSPACSERTEWLTKMLDSMAEQMFSIVLGPDLFHIDPPEEGYFGYWMPIQSPAIESTKEIIMMLPQELTEFKVFGKSL